MREKYQSHHLPFGARYPSPSAPKRTRIWTHHVFRAQQSTTPPRLQGRSRRSSVTTTHEGRNGFLLSAN